MTNVVFCRPEARVVFLAPHGWQEPFYWDLSDTVGLEYNVYFGSIDNEAEPAENRNFHVDVAAMDSFVKRCGVLS